MGVRGLRSSISLSLLVHAFFFFACLFLVSQRTTLAPKKLTWIEIDPLPIKPKDDARFKRQIVQTAPADIVKEAAPDAFLGEKNQRTDRQTVSRDRSTVMGQATPKSVQRSAKELSEQEKAKGAKGKVDSISQLGIPIIPKAKPGDESQEKDQPRWAHYSSNPQDYVKGVKESDRTVLNTKEYMFYGYFQRIRERLDRAWIPILRERIMKIYRSGRHLASDMDHSTRVLVTLNQKGEIVRVQVLSESGTKDLDEAAVRAFNQAGPFPNPPKGIVDDKGEVEIPWEFILKT